MRVNRNIAILLVLAAVAYLGVFGAFFGKAFTYTGFEGTAYSVSLGWADMLLVLVVEAACILFILKYANLEEAGGFKIPALLVFVPLLVIGGLTEIPNFQKQFTHLDEGVHAMGGWFAGRLMASPLSLPATLDSLRAQFPSVFENALLRYPPVYNLGSGVFFLLLGSRGIAARLFPFLCGIVLAMAFGELCKLYGVGEKMARLAPYLLFFFPAVYYWSGRPIIDIIMVLLLTLCWLFFKRGLTDGSDRHWLLAGACFGIGFLTKYEFALILPLFAVLLWKNWRKDLPRGILLAAAPAAALAFPWAWLSLIKIGYLKAIYVNPSQAAMFHPFASLEPAVLAGKAFAWIPQMLFGVAAFVAALAVDRRRNKKISRLEPALFALFWLLVWVFLMGSPDSRHTYFVLVPIGLYSLMVLDKVKWGRALVAGVIVANLVFSVVAMAGLVPFPGGASFAGLAERDNKWDDVAEFVAGQTEGNVMTSLPSSLAFAMLEQGSLGDRTIYDVNWGMPGFTDTLAEDCRSRGVEILLMHRTEEKLQPKEDFALLREYAGDEFQIKVYKLREARTE